MFAVRAISRNKFILFNIVLFNYLSSQMGSEPYLSSPKKASWCSWTRQSDEILGNAEKKILSCMKTAYKSLYVNIGSVVGKLDKIWTISMNEQSQKTPLVMLHGMGAGLALWCPNLDEFAASRPVYAIDLLGFGRSSRPKFSTDPYKVEDQWVESIEAWRREMNISQFILLGHSLGGYISTLYSIKYPERVRHLIAADPWGYSEMTPELEERYRKMPFWVRAVGAAIRPFNPLAVIRAAGPAGQWLITRGRADIAKKYISFIPDAETVIPEYIYQCNSQTPSGESAFHALMTGFGLAKNSLVTRLDQLHPSLPVTEIYGSKSWVPRCPEEVMKAKRPNSQRYPKVIEHAGHHIYLDRPEIFNEFVLEACERADEYDPEIKAPLRPATNHISEGNTAKAEDQSPISKVKSNPSLSVLALNEKL